MNLEELLDNYYAPKKGNDLLVKLIESKMNSSLLFEVDRQELFYGDTRELKLPIIRFSKNIGKPVEGQSKNYDRQFIDVVVKNLKNISGHDGEPLQTRIESFQNFFSGNFQKGLDISNIIAYCMISDAFYHLINDFDGTTAGDIFEPLFAGLFNGTIVEAPEGKRNYAVEDVRLAPASGDLSELKDVSLKLLSPKTNVSQSYVKLLEKLISSGSILYVVAYKEEKSTISFYSYDITTDNVLESFSNILQLVGGRERFIGLTKINDKQRLVQAMLDNHLFHKNEIKKIDKELEYLEKNAQLTGRARQEEYDRLLFIKAKLEREEKRADSMEISPALIKKRGKLLGSFQYDQATLVNALQGYTNIINDKIKNIYDSLTLLNNSINDFFLKGQGKDESLAIEAIRNTRIIEDNLRQQFEKKIIVRTKE